MFAITLVLYSEKNVITEKLINGCIQTFLKPGCVDNHVIRELNKWHIMHTTFFPQLKSLIAYT